ncbi:MAG: ATP-binding protein [Myxococcales bacterium]|nr:ATP-binding protein [Myxococcales bacterium]
MDGVHPGSAGAELCGAGSLSFRVRRAWRARGAAAAVITLIPTLAALGYFFERSRQTSAEELAAAAHTAQQATRVKSRLLAHVSHEIRTPLNGVLGLTQSLLHQPLPLGAHADLLLIQRSGTGLLALINDLLDTARAESGQLELHPGPVDVRQLVRDVVALYRETARNKGLALAFDGEGEACWATTDEVRLRQVLANLVANALKFTQTGAVTVRFRRGPDTLPAVDLALSVEDTGRGISPKDLPRLFEPFTQLHGDVPHEGSGLGLAISQQLATQLGGRLTVESTEGRGSRFTLRISLPAAVAPPSRVTTPKALPAFSALVVDDNQINLRVASALLERVGAVVETAEDGEAAFTRVLDRPFDVVLMDLQMPRLDGIEATRRLRAAGFRAPIVALTASAGPETRDECLACGMNECRVPDEAALDAATSSGARVGATASSNRRAASG